MKSPEISLKVTKNLKKAGFKLKKSSPTILTVVAAVGVVATGVLSAKAAPKAIKLIEEGKKKENIADISKVEIIAIDIKYGWKPFIPAVATGISTIACIFGANILNKKQQAALTSAYMMLETQYRDYRKKVIDLHGEEEDKKIIDSIIKDKLVPVNGESFGTDDEILTFYEPNHDCFFEITMADFLYATEAVNRALAFEEFVCLNEFYKFLGIEPTEEGWSIGWSAETMLSEWGVTPWLDIGFTKKKVNDDVEYYMIVYGMVSGPSDIALKYISETWEVDRDEIISHKKQFLL